MTSVSIIMPAFNSGATILQSIRSVQAQSFKDWELIVVDDGSRDGTADLVEAVRGQDPRVVFLRSRENIGAWNARNTAIEKAQGRYLAFLDSDDLWLPQKLETQLAHMRDRRVALSYSSYTMFYEDGREVVVHAPSSISYRGLLKGSVIGCLTAMYDTSLVGKRYMPELRKHEDYALWLGMLRDGHVACGVDQVLARYRAAGGMSGNKLDVLPYQWEIYRKNQGLSLVASAYYFSHYMMRGVIKHRSWRMLARRRAC